MEPIALTSTMESASRPPSGIARAIEKVRREIRRAAGLRGATLVCAAFGAFVLVSLALDRLFRLGVFARGVLLALYAAALLAAVWRYLVRPVLFPLVDRAIADLLERRRPDLHDRLRSAVDFARDPAVTAAAEPAGDIELALKRLVVREAETLSVGLESSGVVEYRALQRGALAGTASLLAVAAVFWLSAPGSAGLWFRRNVLLGSEEWPYRTYLVPRGFEDGWRGVPMGDALLVDVEVRGEMPERGWIDIDYSRERRRNPMTASGERGFRYLHAEVREPFRFRLRGGDYRSPPFEVRVLERPRLEALRITLIYPDYLEAPPRVVEGDVGELAVEAGTRLELEARSTKPLREAELILGEAKLPLAIDAGDPRSLRGVLLPQRSETLTLQYIDQEGVTPDLQTQVLIRVIPDRPPTVKLRATGIGGMVSAEARIPLEIQANDDHRVRELALIHRLGPRQLAEGEGVSAPSEAGSSAGAGGPPDGAGAAAIEEGKCALESFATGPVVPLSAAFEVGELGIEPERRLSLIVRATDNDTLHGPNSGDSAALEFLVVTHQKLMDDFLRRQEDQRQAFERILEREKAIRDALYQAIDAQLQKPGPLEAKAATELSGHAREEKTLASQVASIALAVEAILTEMKNNRVGEADDIERIGGKVVVPLREVAGSDLPDVSQRLDALRRLESETQRVADGLALAEEIESIIRKMEAIIANMVKLESFSEIVNLLRNILKLQGESRVAAQKAYERLLSEDIFEKND